jgi:GNAT superfamily N-acetyltransferase
VHRTHLQTEIDKSNRLATSIWRSFASCFDEAEIEQRKNLAVSWADKPFTFYNSIFITERLECTSDLETTVDEALTVARRKKFPGLISVCRDLLSDSVQATVNSVLSNRGYATAMPLVGMTAELLPSLSQGPPELRIERASDRGDIVTDLNSTAYGLPLEFGRESLLLPQFWQNAFPYVGYVGDRPVSTATTIIHGDILYLALVATAPDARRKGYAEAVIRHSLQKAHDATGLTRTALHATDAGAPVYKRLGYNAVANFSWYMPSHD